MRGERKQRDVRMALHLPPLPLLPIEPVFSVPIALATSSARLFNAAWAPIASDTRPTKAAATVTVRREMRSLPSIVSIPNR